ncbi:MAG: HAMP domain-containing histidine kinase [Candidatus Obscuribacterales bacterium]|nr:HAMP domain-containing histidine kinase [Candidatus Obscuribacterales bacterium]
MLKWSIAKKGFLLVSVPLAFGLSFVVVLALVLNQSELQFDKIQKSRIALAQVRDNQMIVSQLFLSILGSLDKPPDEACEIVDLSLEDLDKKRASMQAKLGTQAPLRALIEKSINIIDKAEETAKRAKKVFQDAEISPPRRILAIRDEMFELFIEMSKLGKSILISEQKTQLQAPKEANLLLKRVEMYLASGLLCSVVISLSLALFFSRNILRRLRYIESNARNLEIGTLSPPLKTEDEISELDGILHESASALLESRRKERAILDSTAELLFSFDNNFHILSIGQSTSQDWAKPSSSLTGTTITQLLCAESVSAFIQQCETLRTSNSTSPAEFESRLIISNENKRDVSCSLSWSKETSCFYCVARDISEQKAIEMMKQRLVAIASHDLRAPLSSISNTVALMLANNKEKANSHLIVELNYCEQNLLQLNELIRDLLDLARIENTSIISSNSCLSAVDVCSEARESVLFQTENKRLDLEIPYGDIAICGDHRRVVQAVNMMLNAIITSSPKGSKIGIDISHDDGYAKIEIGNRGIQASTDKRAEPTEMFNPSSHFNSDLRSSSVRLSILKAIADAHKGSLGTGNTQEKGLFIWLKLPLYKGVAENSAEES